MVVLFYQFNLSWSNILDTKYICIFARGYTDNVFWGDNSAIQCIR
jgi:hypothetical protein